MLTINPVITTREKEVMDLLARGKTYGQIADAMEITSETVKKHLKNIYRKVGAGNKIEALNKLKYL